MATKNLGRYRPVRTETHSLDRRRFLGLATAGLIGAWSGRLGAQEPQRLPTLPVCQVLPGQRVLVIGAGISGLAAARALTDAGYDVLVIESKNRIGGRIDTSSQWADAPMDLGASWIHGTQNNPIATIARDIGAETVTTSDSAAVIYGSDGETLTSAEEQRLAQLQGQIEQIVLEGQDANQDRPLRETVEAGIGFGGLSPQDQHFVNFILGEVEQDSAGSAASLSTYWFDDPGYFNGPEVVFPAGYRVITDHLAAGLAIELGQTVSDIAVASDGVTVTTQSGVFHGQCAIVTLPLGVLKAGTVRFSPGLPSAMQQAIDTLRMGVLNKTHLRFPTAFWPENLDWMQQVPQQHGEWLNWLNMSRVVNRPILAGFNAADFGRQIESWSDQAIVADGMEKLRSIFGTGIPDPVDHQITRWASDPQTRGSYSYLPAGADPAMRDALAGSLEGRVFFAGEATNRQYYPTVHGAYLSGLAAVERVAPGTISNRLLGGNATIFCDDFESGDTSRWSTRRPTMSP
ncbi:MAG: FAD-dependent oxidoreductase [Acidobacteriota bacterium]